MQERQSPVSGPPAFVNPDRAHHRGRQRAIKLVALAFPVALALFALGCPQAADLQNPQMYDPPPGSSGSSSGGSGGSGAMVDCETECVKTIVTMGASACKVCHGSDPLARLDMGTLDMASPGLSARLKDQASAHKGIVGDSSGCPKGDKIIDSANPDASWLLKKIKGTQGACGTVMPSTGALSATDQACMETFVRCVATGGSAMPSGGSGSGGTAAASGGTAAGGGGSGGTAAGSGGTATSGSGGTGGA